MNDLVFSQINTSDLIEKIAERTAQLLNSKKTQQSESVNDLMTRQETADFLKVNLATLWRWTKNGKLIQHGIGGRIYYKRSEVANAIVSINSKK